jgi:hypothetical protein
MKNFLSNPVFHKFPPALVKNLLNQENPFNSREKGEPRRDQSESWHEPLKSIIIIRNVEI